MSFAWPVLTLDLKPSHGYLVDLLMVSYTVSCKGHYFFLNAIISKKQSGDLGGGGGCVRGQREGKAGVCR